MYEMLSGSEDFEAKGNSAAAAAAGSRGRIKLKEAGDPAEGGS
jgi:hypothetical protein